MQCELGTWDDSHIPLLLCRTVLFRSRKALFLIEFQQLYGIEAQGEVAFEKARCIPVSVLPKPRAWAGLWPAAEALSLPVFLPSIHTYGRLDQANHQVAADHMVTSLLPDRLGRN